MTGTWVSCTDCDCVGQIPPAEARTIHTDYGRMLCAKCRREAQERRAR